MLAIERHRKIISMLAQHGLVKVSSLADTLSVTEETIRRDLEKLESTGQITRIHGGAIPANVNEMEAPFAEREVRNLGAKAQLAGAALTLIEPGDSIALDASTTILQMARIMPNEPHLVLSYSIGVQMDLCERDAISVISCGGRLLPRSLSYGGSMAEKFVEQFHVDKFFFSCRGLSIERGISDANDMQAHIKQKLMSIADQSILVVDHSKFDQEGFARIASLEQVSVVVTNAPMPEAYTAWFADKGIRVIEA